jgi:transmembrane protein 17
VKPKIVHTRASSTKLIEYWNEFHQQCRIRATAACMHVASKGSRFKMNNRPHHAHAPREITSSLSLQILLYFNALSSAIYAIFSASLSVYKSNNLLSTNMGIGRYIAPFALVMWLITELPRLWFGYTGNLREKVPQLSAFQLLTIFPSLPAVVYLALLQPVRFPIETSLGLTIIFFEILELVVSYRALRRQIAIQTASFFRLVQEDPAEAETRATLISMNGVCR